MFKRVALVLSICAASGVSQADSLALVGSINPITLIVSDIAGDVAEVTTLLPPGASPHDFALKPSDRVLLNEADLLFWTGPMTEPYLERVIAASGTANIPWVMAEAETDQESNGEHEHEHEHEDEHDHDQFHPWLSPESAADFAARVADKLTELNPEAKSQIEQNLTKFNESLAQMDQANAEKLSAVKDRGFVVFHDAYRGLVEHYELNQVAAFSLDPSRKPGARHLQELRDQLDSQGVSCIFIEPQFEPATLDTITRGMDVSRGQLDPLASTVPAGEGGYVRFISGLVDEMAACLAN